MPAAVLLQFMSLSEMLKKLLIALVAVALSQNAIAQVDNSIVPTAPAGTSNNQAASTAFVAGASGGSSSGTVLYANNFSGADLGVQIGACVAALPQWGGTCDARSLPNAGTIGTFTVAKSGVTILLPCGLFLQTGSIIVQAANGVAGLIVTGCGASQGGFGTSILWQGNSTDPAFDLRGVRDSEFSNFTLSAISSAPLAEGIRRETWTGAVSTRVTFRNIIIAGNIANSLYKGIRWCTGLDCGGGVVIGNNDLDTIQNVLVANYTNCAFSIEGTQSKTHIFLNSSVAGQTTFSNRGVCTTQGTGTGLAGAVTFLTNGTSGCSSGTYTVVGGTGTPATLTGTAAAGIITSLAVNTAGSYSVMPPVNPTISGTGCSVAPIIAYSTNAATNSGSFRWYGGAGGGNQVADFDLGGVTDSLVISGCNFESSKRLLQTGSAGSATWSISIVGCRWTSNGINPDGKAIIYKLRGPLYVSGFDIETGGSTVPPVFSIESSGTPETGTAIANTIQSASAVAGYNPFVCSPISVSCWTTIGNMVSDNSGNEFQVPNSIQNGSAPLSNTQTCSAGNAYTVIATDIDLIINDAAATCTLTLLSAAAFPGRVLTIRTINAQAVVSNASNVVPLIGGAAGTALLAATAGKWGKLKSDGTNWLVMEGN